jgi:hypothetical protein
VRDWPWLSVGSMSGFVQHHAPGQYDFSLDGATNLEHIGCRTSSVDVGSALSAARSREIYCGASLRALF